MKIANNITELIGRTPLVSLNRYAEKMGIKAHLIAKTEYFNPGGSVKDRIALAMIREAEKRGELQPGGTIIEPTSGNTGVGLAMVSAVLGYKLILTMPETMSIERRTLLQALGAKLILTPGTLGMEGAIAEAEKIRLNLPGSIVMGQFSNSANPAEHERSTGPEIWEATDGTVDIFVGGIGTGGTISGVGRYLKSCNPSVQIVGVEPTESAVLNGEPAASHLIQGIGAGFIPSTYHPDCIDEVMVVKGNDAIAAGRELAKTEGLLVGISSGAVLVAATSLAMRQENVGKNIVLLLPDTGERYLSTPLYAFNEYPL